jgi:FHS family L-fucose permease-like MFS transporter
MLIIVLLSKMPKNCEAPSEHNFIQSIKRIFSISNYRNGVIAQFFYVGAQIMCWTFIIQYGTRTLMSEGMAENAAEVLSQKFNIAAMGLFCCSRFICTYLLRFIKPGKLLMILAICALFAICGVIGFTDRRGIYCLIVVSGCMSLMFPTIYGIALKGLNTDVKFGAAGLIMAILGGSILPPLQARIIDVNGTIAGLPSVNVSFIIPLICFIFVAAYGYKTERNRTN